MGGGKSRRLLRIAEGSVDCAGRGGGGPTTGVLDS